VPLLSIVGHAENAGDDGIAACQNQPVGPELVTLIQLMYEQKGCCGLNTNENRSGWLTFRHNQLWLTNNDGVAAAALCIVEVAADLL
jgi:hypothetical protein